MRPVTRASAAVLAAGLGLAGLAPIAAQSPQLHERVYREQVAALGAGKLLVAARRLPDPNFSRTVILLAAFSEEGALGVIVNRRTEVTLTRLFPEVTPTISSGGQAYAGGPVQRDGMIALLRAPDPPTGARHVVDGVHLVSSREVLEGLIASGVPSTSLRVYLGYAGWGPGQLESETAQGAWHVLDGDADVVFDPDPSAVWPRQIARTEVISARLARPSDMLSRSSQTKSPNSWVR